MDTNENKNLNLLINDCIELENDIKNINIMKEKVKKIDDIEKIKIEFYPDDEGINEFLQKVKSFGEIKNYDNYMLDNYMFKSSSIINNSIDYQKCIINWIKEKTNKNISKFELIFKMSENGSTSDDFHNKCDNQGPLLILIKTNNNRTFGGYSPLFMEKNSGSKYDKTNQTFLFSLNLMKKYDMININKPAINCSGWIFYFGAVDIGFENNLKNGLSWVNSQCNFLSNNNLELTGNKGFSCEFVSDEIEVYKVKF